MRESSVSFEACDTVLPLGLDSSTHRRVFLTEFEGAHTFITELGRVAKLRQTRTVAGQTVRWRAWYVNRDGVSGWLDFPTRREAVDWMRREREALDAVRGGAR